MTFSSVTKMNQKNAIEPSRLQVHNGVRRAGVMTIALFFTMVKVGVSEFQTGALN